MADKSKIEWTDSTFNPWIGCTKVSPACDHCYAAVSTPTRALGIEWGAGQPRHRTSAANWKLPIRWNREDFRACGDCGWRGAIDTLEDDTCPNCGKHERLDPARRRVFCASLADVFDNEVDPVWRRDLFELILRTPDIDWLLLTKRIGNVAPMLEDLQRRARYYEEWALFDNWRSGTPPTNVWLGATICNQVEADRDIPKLLATPATVRFLSMEPLLGPVNFAPYLREERWQADGQVTTRGIIPGTRVDWVIAGGESGHDARPMYPDWGRSLRNQCKAAGVPFLFKQWGEWGPLEQPLGADVPLTGYGIKGDWPMLVDLCDPHRGLIRCGKKNAGRLLDGIEHNGYPDPRNA